MGEVDIRSNIEYITFDLFAETWIVRPYDRSTGTINHVEEEQALEHTGYWNLGVCPLCFHSRQPALT